MEKQNLVGMVFGKLTVVKEAGSARRYQYKWECVCDCGASKIILGSNLKQGYTKSCGCLNKAAITTHGRSGKTPEYRAWAAMIQRCNNPKESRFHSYGGRGIKVEPSWVQFENFFMDMGKRPSSEYSLDRIDNDGDYTKSNCRWATRIEQQRNIRSNVKLIHNGVTLRSLPMASEIIGVSASALAARIRRGWNIDELTRPASHVKRNGQNMGGRKKHKHYQEGE